MSLRKRLGMISTSGSSEKNSMITDMAQDKEEQERKCRIHYKVIDQMDLAVLSQTDDDVLDQELDTAIRGIIQEEGLNLSPDDNDRLVNEIKHEVLGLGPLEPLLADESISEIMCNGYNNVYVERKGRLEKIGVRFRDDSHLMKIIDKIATNIGRRIDESSPMVDARLADGSRVNAIISPLAIDGPCLTIRKFSKDPLQVSDLIKFGSISAQAARLMEGVVKARLNVIISGGTGSGKTTMLNVFSSFIPHDERIVTIEDSAELQLQQDHVVRLETRPPNMEGHGEITIRGLVKNCLRMRPDRIVVGEVRSGEALDMMQAMSTGHDGSITTLHANTPRDCLGRLETLVAMGGLDISEKAIRRQIAAAIHVIVQVARLSDGSRKVISFSEVTGMEGNTITLQEIFKFEQTGVDQHGKVIGQFGPTGIRPAFSNKLKAHGFELDGNMFSQ
ncbi:MAG: CpaF family protein [Candidatus Magnetomorum sp.]|nr:CpaF family protein [Candidatus Magnetomorum sp.]